MYHNFILHIYLFLWNVQHQIIKKLPDWHPNTDISSCSNGDRGKQDIFISAHFYFSMFNILLIIIIKMETYSFESKKFPWLYNEIQLLF